MAGSTAEKTATPASVSRFFARARRRPAATTHVSFQHLDDATALNPQTLAAPLHFITRQKPPHYLQWRDHRGDHECHYTAHGRAAAKIASFTIQIHSGKHAEHD